MSHFVQHSEAEVSAENAKPTLSELAARCRIAAIRIPVGSFWQHYKNGDIYEVIAMSIKESTGEVEVVYRPAPRIEEERYEGLHRRKIDDPDLSELNFHRPMGEWLGAAADNVPRFARMRRMQVYAHVAA